MHTIGRWISDLRRIRMVPKQEVRTAGTAYVQAGVGRYINPAPLIRCDAGVTAHAFVSGQVDKLDVVAANPCYPGCSSDP